MVKPPFVIAFHALKGFAVPMTLFICHFVWLCNRGAHLCKSEVAFIYCFCRLSIICTIEQYRPTVCNVACLFIIFPPKISYQPRQSTEFIPSDFLMLPYYLQQPCLPFRIFQVRYNHHMFPRRVSAHIDESRKGYCKTPF